MEQQIRNQCSLNPFVRCISGYESTIFRILKKSELQKIKNQTPFANTTYLSEWSGDLSFGQLNANAPVTNISWFAAKRILCECQGKRLATLDEWEYVAMADEKKKDARSREEFNKYILSWYEKTKPTTIL